MSEGEFAQFVADEGRRLLRVAYLLTGDGERARDLLQDALVRVWERRDRIIAAGALGSYTRRTLVTEAGQRRRRVRWREVTSSAVPDSDAARPAEVEVHLDLIAALRRLPLKQRAVIALRYFEDLTERETADVLGCAVGTVKSDTARAFAALRRHLGDLKEVRP